MSQDLSKETGVLLRAIEESFQAGIYDLPQALEKAFRGGVLCGKVEGLSTAKDIIEERA
jgi:hypothetical protein